MELYCSCRKPHDAGPMIACDRCDVWFHYRCVGLTKLSKAFLSKEWFCEICVRLKGLEDSLVMRIEVLEEKISLHNNSKCTSVSKSTSTEDLPFQGTQSKYTCTDDLIVKEKCTSTKHLPADEVYNALESKVVKLMQENEVLKCNANELRGKLRKAHAENNELMVRLKLKNKIRLSLSSQPVQLSQRKSKYIDDSD